MNRQRDLSRISTLALILVVTLLTGCFPFGQKAPSAPPPATPTTGVKQPALVIKTSTLPPKIAASPTLEIAVAPSATSTPEPTQEVKPTETLAPTDTPSAQSAKATSTPTPAAASNTDEVYQPISNCAASRLHRGDIVRVAPGILYVTIRSNADTHPSDNIIRRLYKTELAQLRGNPVCNYGWILWPIRTADGTLGWVPESADGQTFWLEKVNGAFFPTVTATPNG